MQGHEPTHYDTLRLPWLAAPDEVRQAWRRLARDVHPDRRPDCPGAPQAMARINAAYAVLSDPARRAPYDDWVRARQARMAAQRAAAAAAEGPRGFAAAWPWLLLFATTAFAAASVGTVLYKQAVPTVVPLSSQLPAQVTAQVTAQSAPSPSR